MDFQALSAIIDKGGIIAVLLYMWYVEHSARTRYEDYIKEQHERLSDDNRELSKKKSDWPHSLP